MNTERIDLDASAAETDAVMRLWARWGKVLDLRREAGWEPTDSEAKGWFKALDIASDKVRRAASDKIRAAAEPIKTWDAMYPHSKCTYCGAGDHVATECWN